MSRVASSRTFAIAEDDTATAALTFQTPSTPTPADQYYLHPMGTRIVSNTVTMKSDPLEAEVRGLKAAYKSALGVGKKLKKGRSKRKDRQTDSQETVDDELPVVELALASPAPASPVQSSRGTAPAAEDLETHSIKQSVRTTRNQAAKAQAGQYIYDTSEFFRSEDCSVISEKIRGLDYISLFSGRRANLNRTGKVSTIRKSPDGNYSTNHTLSLAKDIQLESHFETVVASAVDTLKTTTHNENHKEQEAIWVRHPPAGSPVKTLEEIEKAYGPSDPAYSTDVADEDSFVKQIICRTPAKPVSRIEDSLEALDQLEEALDALNQATQTEIMPSLQKPNSRWARDSLEGTGKEKQVGKKPAGKQNAAKGQQPLRTGYASVRVKSAQKQAPTLKKAASMNFKPASSSTRSSEEQGKAQPSIEAAIKRPISLLPPKETARSTKAPTRSNFTLPGEAVALKLKEQREARVAQRQSSDESYQTVRNVCGPKIKSTKPPTKPTFELPGEEVSRRKRAAHEARLKAQEEEERRRREFKAKPIRNSVVPNMVPRETLASRARQSKGGTEHIEDGNLSISKRGSNVGAHRPSIAVLALANSSAPRAKGTFIPPVRKLSPSVTAPSSMTGCPVQRVQRAEPTTDSGLRKRAKEIYNRDALLTAEMDKGKRDREAAAKRAREDAAERGRQASREWAEK
ncbi:carboxylesterase family protein [Drepanopeziza brunnea f. sp. 'multigermtubi' MB_m1]|uniref:Carboxylesterase family protein n=1 Tax=Marssonina brunnea f. sp. multigermtubi (strain MB_m1) TaxID=1072389 RepID=K1WUG8_MARBU|nr:carboxylesterase family protein [Drepanopeziza brunnea f. sp. 'multigermtubi' MB_m1]EKD21325.1 carboxylesterase family protein [Drepanopeziza brunnea f. sp. 'multigermtubi' MB_m1]